MTFNTMSPWGASALAKGLPDTVEFVRKSVFASQADRDAALAVPEWQQRQAAAESAPQAGTGMAEIERAWGSKADQHKETLSGYLQSLPPERLKALQDGPQADDPVFAQQLLGQARLPRPADMSRAGIEKWMGTNRGDYFRNEEVQQAYRAHIAADLAKGN
jgi:hypothetical protein